MTLEQNRIENLKKKLYSRDEPLVLDERSPIQTNGVEVENNSWGQTDFKIDEPIEEQKGGSFLKKFLVVSATFFVISICIFFYNLFFGGVLSSENVDIKITGPSSISSGDNVNLVLSILNENKAPLESVDRKSVV